MMRGVLVLLVYTAAAAAVSGPGLAAAWRFLAEFARVLP